MTDNRLLMKSLLSDPSFGQVTQWAHSSHCRGRGLFWCPVITSRTDFNLSTTLQTLRAREIFQDIFIFLPIFSTLKIHINFVIIKRYIIVFSVTPPCYLHSILVPSQGGSRSCRELGKGAGCIDDIISPSKTEGVCTNQEYRYYLLLLTACMTALRSNHSTIRTRTLAFPNYSFQFPNSYPGIHLYLTFSI